MTTHTLNIGWERGAHRVATWPRTLAITIMAGLILSGGVLARATKMEMDATKLEAASNACSMPASAYGAKDPYGFGPRAAAEPGAPGGAADQEDLSITERPAPQPAADKTDEQQDTKN